MSVAATNVKVAISSQVFLRWKVGTIKILELITIKFSH